MHTSFKEQDFCSDNNNILRYDFIKIVVQSERVFYKTVLMLLHRFFNMQIYNIISTIFLLPLNINSFYFKKKNYLLFERLFQLKCCHFMFFRFD